MTFLRLITNFAYLTLLHSERPKLYTILAFLSAMGLNIIFVEFGYVFIEKVDRDVYERGHIFEDVE